MKKFILLILLLLCGCSKNQTICKSSIKNKKQNYESNITYTIFSTNNYVTKVKINEQYKSTNKNTLEYFNSYLKLTYLTLKEEYKNIIYKTNNTQNKIEYDISIDYKNIDIKQMVKDGYLKKDYVINNHLTRTGLIKQYESKGAKCK